MASGSANFSGAYGSHFRMEVNYGLVSQNIGANSSVIRVWVNLYSDGYGSMYGVTAPLTINVNGGSAVHNVGVNINTNSGVTLFSQEYNIGHNGDGTKTVNVSARLALNIGGYGEASWGTNYGLPTIPRASSSSDITGTLGRALTININRASGSFTHTVKYNFGSLSGTIGTGVGTSISWTPPMSLATAMPVKTTDWGNITIETYNGGSKIGSKTYRMTLTIPDSVVPSLGSITLTETNSIAKQLLNSSSMFVQNQSDIKVTFNSAAGNTGSSITSYHARIVGRPNTCSSNNDTLGRMNYSGNVTVEAWVVDSRGRTSNKVTKQVSVMEYTPPAIYFTATRGNDTASSNKVIVSRTASISRLLVNNVQKNTFKLEFAYGAYGTSDRTPDSGANINQTTGTYSITRSDAVMSATFDVGKSYKIYGRLTDAFGSTPWIEYEIHPERMVTGMAETTVSFGKYPEIPNAVDSLWPYYYNNQRIEFVKGETVDTLPNDLTTSGAYKLSTSTTNLPALNHGQLLVVRGGGDTIGQIYMPYNESAAYIRTANGIGWNTPIWKKWVKLANTDEVNVIKNSSNMINTGWQPAGYTGSYYKRSGDMLAIRFDFIGTGGTFVIATVPSSVWVAPQSYMIEIAEWSISGADTGHVQVNSGTGDFNILNSKNGQQYRGQILLMV
ncbi:DUF859 family phage minor structural protein [Streptococcus sp.]|uniref:DUF859 family phage minor structural protein n=1 Tax=Streptococcus sp. TaxID=1306 RepID=UPI0025D05303|nr:DUF859 family phage minor structural protein [Streptococcus sp.]